MAAFELDDGLGDWRIAAASRLASDVPAAFSGGPSHKAGTPVYQSELLQRAPGDHISFVTPSATAMAFHIAVKAGTRANDLVAGVTYRSILTPYGRGKGVPSEALPQLYDFFEQCMIAVIFSYQALEVYANHTIARRLKQPMEVKRGKNRLLLQPDEMERQLSTDEKLASILPKVFNLPTPKGKAIWEKYRTLKEARDACVHLKSEDLKANKSGKGHLFFTFLSVDPLTFPGIAESMIRYFVHDNAHRWLSALPTAKPK